MRKPKTPTSEATLSEILNQPNNAAAVAHLDQVEQTAKESEPQPKTLGQMAGGFLFAGQDVVSGTQFFGRKPKLGQLERIAALANHAASEEDTIHMITTRMVELASLLLFVPDGEGLWRRATVEEIKEAFDADEIVQINVRFSGLKVSSEGNA